MANPGKLVQPKGESPVAVFKIRDSNEAGEIDMALSLGKQLTQRALTGRAITEALARGFGSGGTLGIVSSKT
ncbi:MAG: hypothetical protein HSCHL_1036 [Hydrogenibacillus schlegelii]|uniref:Uncharacterized protein n=1 Tax=Hydrogenibacillus schlegelii TaxID=1484 RepID=A0A2T5G6Q0_HYDSH|nr:hypothetical protein [Hydrogenibacillus schlegelii]PTQ51860.1 MAG: hypothetical protein HSCHL_1036 [Hydrogenibacillus schlegelii]